MDRALKVALTAVALACQCPLEQAGPIVDDVLAGNPEGTADELVAAVWAAAWDVTWPTPEAPADVVVQPRT